MIEIWEPKYSNNTARINVRKVSADNEIIFTQAKHLEGNVYRMPGEEIKKHPVVSNGRGMVYEVPMPELEKWLIKEEK